MNSRYVSSANFGGTRLAELPGRVKLFLVMGGGRSILLQLPLLRKAGLVVVIDVPQELAYLAPFLAEMPNVRMFSLGAGHTAATLCAEASPQLQQAIADLAPVNATKGMGQRPTLAYRATELLVASREFQEFLRQLPDLIVWEGLGMPSCVEIHAVGSLAGGVATGGLLMVAKSLSEACADLGIPISVHFDLLGGITFALLGDHIFVNVAATLWRFSEDLRAGRWHPLVAPTARVLELAPMKTDQFRRNEELLADSELLHSLELQAYLTRVQPNLAAAGALGNFALWTMSRFNLLDPERHICPTVAEYARSVIESGLKSAAPSLSRIHHVDYQKQMIPARRESLEEVVALAVERDVATTLNALRQPAETGGYTLSIQTDDGREYDLSRIVLDFAETPPTLSGTVDRLHLLASQRHALAAEVANLELTLSEIDAEAQAVEVRLSAMVQKGSGRRLFGSQRRWERKLKAAAEAIRGLADERWPQAQLLLAMQIAMSELQKEEAVLRGRVDRLVACLTSWCPTGDRSQPKQSCIYTKTLDADFSRLLKLPQLSRPEQVRLLQEQVGGVSLAGLAMIVGADSDRLDVLANEIATASCPVNHPALGGKAQSIESQRVLVLPPIPVEYRTRLVELIQASDRESLILYADTAQRCCTVVRYRISVPRAIEDLFPGRLASDLQRAAADPHRDLIFPDGAQNLDPHRFPPWQVDQVKEPHVVSSSESNGTASEEMH